MIDRHLSSGRRVSGGLSLGSHFHVLICLRRDPDLRIRDLSERIGLTERAVQSTLDELQALGFLSRVREGRRNHYMLHLEAPLGHPLESHLHVGDLIDFLTDDAHGHEPRAKGTR